MIQSILYIEADDPRLEQIKKDLSQFEERFPYELHVVDIRKDKILIEEFGTKAPVLDIGVYRLLWDFDASEIENAFIKAESRLEEAIIKKNGAMEERITKPLKMSKSDRFSRWFSSHYMFILNGFAFVYVFLAILAPIFMQIGWQGAGRTIYKVYRPLCHQLAFRSFFMFGEQPYYPRELAGVEGVKTYHEVTGYDEYDLETARDFLGNETLGYKMALCERDIAIYGFIFLFGVLFSITGKKIKPLPWYLWLLLGLGPIGLDGFSQLLGQTGLSIFSWLPLRESTPFLRTLTGALFGLATAWFGYPYLEESVKENRYEMRLKGAITEQIDAEGNQ
jgi:uncharacterized membrane protein